MDFNSFSMRFSVLVNLSGRSVDFHGLQTGLDKDSFMVRDSWNDFYFIYEGLVTGKENFKNVGGGLSYSSRLRHNLIKEWILHYGQ